MAISFNSFSNYLDIFSQWKGLPLATQKKAVVIGLIAYAALLSLTAFIIERNSRKVTVTEPNGTSYRCLVEKVNGQAKIVFDSFFGGGAILEGNFTKGKLNGQGKILNSGFNVYEGTFKNGHLVNGKIVCPDGKWLSGFSIEGEIKNNYPVKGKVIFFGDVLEGEFETGKFWLKKGKKICANGRIEEGEFSGGNLHNHGKVTFSNGDIAEGEFNHGNLVKGKITYSNGEIAEGDFITTSVKNRMFCLNGKGKMTYPNGKIEEGTFKSGKFVS